MADKGTHGGERSSEEIRRDIEHTRSQMDDTVEAIGEKLSAARILDELWVRVRSGDGAAVLGEAVKDHPVPFALMGLGVGWLAVEQARAREERHARGRNEERVGPGTYGRAEGRVGPYGSEAVDHEDPEWAHTGRGEAAKGKVAGAAGAVKDRAAEAASSIKDRAAHLKDSVSDAGGTIADRAHEVQEKAGHAREAVMDKASAVAHAAARQVREGADRTRSGFLDLLDDNPLALGAIAFGVGLAGGLGPPSTRWEDEHMGPLSDSVKDEVKQVGEETTEKVKHVARDATDAAREELRHQREVEDGPEAAVREAIAEVKDSARDIARAARDAARDSAEAEDLTGEGLRRRATRAARRARGKTRAAGD